jgi:hypothetical protein
MTGPYRLVTLCNGPITDLKSSVHPLTWFFQTILRSIYRRFSRQSKLRSCLVSQGESSFPHYSDQDYNEYSSRRSLGGQTSSEFVTGNQTRTDPRAWPFRNTKPRNRGGLMIQQLKETITRPLFYFEERRRRRAREQLAAAQALNYRALFARVPNSDPRKP